MQIIAITGFLDEGRVRHLLLSEVVNEQLTASDLVALEEFVIPLFTRNSFCSRCCKYGPCYSIDIACNTELFEHASGHLFIKNKERTLTEHRRTVSTSSFSNTTDEKCSNWS